MVYIGNIFKAFQNLKNGEMICLMSKSNRKYFIGTNDLIEKCNGDLKVQKNTCYCIIDTAEIETMIVAKEQTLRGGL